MAISNPARTPAVSGHRFTELCLKLAILLPVGYYGAQLATAPFYPGYSVMSNVASDLGSDLSPMAPLFNGILMVLGVLAWFAAAGFVRAAAAARVSPWWTTLAAVTLVMNGVQTLWAAYYPLPDPRHGGHPAFVLFMVLMPIAMSGVILSLSRSPKVRLYVVATLLLHAFMFGVFTRLLPFDIVEQGLKQRLFTLGVFPTIAVAGYLLLQQVKRSASNTPDEAGA